MKFQSLLFAAILTTPIGALADGYHQQGDTTTQRSCYKEIYREEYVAGNIFSKGYVQSYTDTVQVPCPSLIWKQVRRHHHHYYFPTYRRYKPHRNQVLVSRSVRPNSCRAGSSTTGGILGGSLAAALSKKDAYGWSVPLGAVLGMGIANADC